MMRALVLLLVLGTAAAHAEPVQLRMATVAPEGTAWANLLKAFGKEVEISTGGAVKVKWYFGGITGDELQTFEAIKQGHLDGMASGGMICERLSPSMKIQGLAGVFQSRDEAAYVMERIWDTIQEETQHAGFEMLIVSGLGPEVIFSRTPVRSMKDLRRMKLWRWSADEVGITVAGEMGLLVVPTDLDLAAKAYEDQRIDGFIAIPTAALAFQWSTQARYITDLRSGYLSGCVTVRNGAIDRLSPEHHRLVRAITAKYDALFRDVGRRQDEALLGGLFQKQGLKPIPPSEAFHSEFFDSARAAREHLSATLVPRALLDRVMRMLADYRVEHGSAKIVE